jgi:DNA-binding NarL/FixJ family response regulator
MENKKIRVLLADDQKLFLDNLKVILEMNDKEIEVTSLAINGQEAVQGVERDNPDIALLDVRMPIMDGVDAAARIHENSPHVKIMMLTTFEDDTYVHDALKNGASGYILKNTTSEHLILAIKSLNAGQGLISPSLIAKLLSPSKEESHRDHKNDRPRYNLDILSSRERDVLFLLSRGYDNQAISDRLFIALQTVKNHISHMYEKLDIHDRMSAMKAAGDPRLKEWCQHLMKN